MGLLYSMELTTFTFLNRKESFKANKKKGLSNA